jgi:hypothetical protein
LLFFFGFLGFSGGGGSPESRIHGGQPPESGDLMNTGGVLVVLHEHRENGEKRERDRMRGKREEIERIFFL